MTLRVSVSGLHSSSPDEGRSIPGKHKNPVTKDTGYFGSSRVGFLGRRMNMKVGGGVLGSQRWGVLASSLGEAPPSPLPGSRR